MKVVFQNTIFWCSIWALNHANHFYNLTLIRFKAYSTPTCISILLSNFGWFFQKIPITYNLVQNCWDKIENPFFNEKHLFCQIKFVGKFLGFWQQNLARFNIDISGSEGEFGIWKIELFLTFTGFSTFVWRSFVQGCGKFLKHKP